MTLQVTEVECQHQQHQQRYEKFTGREAERHASIELLHPRCVPAIEEQRQHRHYCRIEMKEHLHI